MGRIGVDVYPQQIGVSLREVETFGKFLGGSSTNVAVAAARYGAARAVITRTGDDPFGAFLHDALQGFGVDDRWVTPVDGLPTPVTFCEIFPPDDFPLYFYREPKAPDLEIRPDELDLDAIRAREGVLGHGHRALAGAVRTATLAALEARGAPASPCSTSTTARCSGPRAEARRWVREALAHVTVAVGNRDEWETAVGEREPRAVGLRERASTWPSAGRSACADDGDEVVEVPPVPVDVVNGLGAGDAFGGALCHGLLAGWELERTMRFCNAAGALVASRLACADAMPTEDEVEALLADA